MQQFAKLYAQTQQEQVLLDVFNKNSDIYRILQGQHEQNQTFQELMHLGELFSGKQLLNLIKTAYLNNSPYRTLVIAQNLKQIHQLTNPTYTKGLKVSQILGTHKEHYTPDYRKRLSQKRDFLKYQFYFNKPACFLANNNPALLKHLNNLTGFQKRTLLKRIIEQTLSKNGYPLSDEMISRLFKCAEQHYIYFCAEHIDEREHGVYCCDMPFCPFCVDYRSYKTTFIINERLQEYLKIYNQEQKAKIEQGNGYRYKRPYLRFVTITYKKTGIIKARSGLTKARKDFYNLRRRKETKNLFKNSIVAFEPDMSTGYWHMHCVCVGDRNDYVKQSTLSQYWKEITKDSVVVDIREIKNRTTPKKHHKDFNKSEAISYISKYLSKIPEAPLEKQILFCKQEIPKAKKYSCLGAFHKLKLKPKKEIPKCPKCNQQMQRITITSQEYVDYRKNPTKYLQEHLTEVHEYG